MRLPLPLLNAQQRHPDHIAEVIETSTTEFLAQCLESDQLSFPPMPAFGSWVKATEEEAGNQVYGVVYHASTSPIDSVHRARALGLSLEQLREQQPQIFAMLKTEFRVAIVGFKPHSSSIVYQHLPPRPPQLHQAVYCCKSDEVIEFTQQLDFVRSLLQMNAVPAEALIAATIREIYQLRKADRTWLVNAGRVLSLQLKDDYDRLRTILGQIHL
jgi:hypothetical protein